MSRITIFARNWYEADGKTPAYNAPRRKIRVVETEEEARNLCHQWNETRPKSWHKRSRKYEFTTNY